MSAPSSPLADASKLADQLVTSLAAADQAVAARITDLEAQLAAAQQQQQGGGRFPADPGKGRMIVGMAASGQSLVQIAQRTKDTGRPPAFRQYRNSGISDFAVPAAGAKPDPVKHPMAYAVWRDHQAGRVSAISGKPGIQQLAAHQFGPELDAWHRWLDAQPGYTIEIVHHEPSNDGRPAPEFVEAQRWVRASITHATGGKPKRIIFIGSLMSYAWTAQAKSKDGFNGKDWLPEKGVWDAWGLDHYCPNTSPTVTLLNRAQWKDSVADITAAGIPLAITEVGVAQGDPNGGKKLSEFVTECLRLGCVIFLYFDSNAGAGGKPQPNQADWWTLSPGNGAQQAYYALMQSTTSVYPNQALAVPTAAVTQLMYAATAEGEDEDEEPARRALVSELTG
jgi:hypothetical protein